MKKRISILVLIIAILAVSMPAFADQNPGAPQKSSFSDTTGHWARDVIDRMAEKGIANGVGQNKFMPDMSMKRSEFAALLHRVLGIKIAYFAAPDITKVFDDVRNEDWYASNLNDLVTVGIVDDKLHFRPNDDITREELVHYMMNAYRYKMNTDAAEAKNLFSDNNQMKPEYRGDVYKAVGLGLVMGRGNNLFAPGGKSTRAEALVVIHRFMEALKREIGSMIKVEPAYTVKDNEFVMTISITNNSSAAVNIQHSSGQKYDFKLLDADKNIVYTWSADKLFIMAFTDTRIAAGETVTFSEALDLETYKDIVDKAAAMKAFITGQSDDFKISPEGYEIKIQK